MNDGRNDEIVLAMNLWAHGKDGLFGVIYALIDTQCAWLPAQSISLGHEIDY
jgi:hypothetical protein